MKVISFFSSTLFIALLLGATSHTSLQAMQLYEQNEQNDCPKPLWILAMAGTAAAGIAELFLICKTIQTGNFEQYWMGHGACLGFLTVEALSNSCRMPSIDGPEDLSDETELEWLRAQIKVLQESRTPIARLRK